MLLHQGMTELISPKYLCSSCQKSAVRILGQTEFTPKHLFLKKICAENKNLLAVIALRVRVLTYCQILQKAV